MSKELVVKIHVGNDNQNDFLSFHFSCPPVCPSTDFRCPRPTTAATSRPYVSVEPEEGTTSTRRPICYPGNSDIRCQQSTAPPPERTTYPTRATYAPTYPTRATPAPTYPTRATPAPTYPTRATYAPTYPTRATPAPTYPTRATYAPTYPTRETPAQTYPTRATAAPTKSPKLCYPGAISPE